MNSIKKRELLIEAIQFSGLIVVYVFAMIYGFTSNKWWGVAIGCLGTGIFMFEAIDAWQKYRKAR